MLSCIHKGFGEPEGTGSDAADGDREGDAGWHGGGGACGAVRAWVAGGGCVGRATWLNQQDRL